jgi:hypothetical protein
MIYYDIIEKRECETIAPTQKRSIEKSGSFNGRLIKLHDYEKVVKVIIDDSGNEYACISPKTLKCYLGNSIKRRFDALFQYRVYTVKYMGKVYRIKNVDEDLIREKSKRYWTPKEKKKAYYAKWISRAGNKTKRYNVLREWKIKNKEHVKKYNRRYCKERRSVDEKFKLKTNLRTRIRQALKNNQKSESLKILMGCSVQDLKTHLESLWLEGMSWENYGSINGERHAGWHVDHIIPCSSFDLSSPEEQRKCFHYSNLQPLWGIDNIKKSNQSI